MHQHEVKYVIKMVDALLNLSILDTGKRVLWQALETHMKYCISSGSALFAKIKTIFRDRNILKFRNFNL